MAENLREAFELLQVTVANMSRDAIPCQESQTDG